jgi:hypothetical protein
MRSRKRQSIPRRAEVQSRVFLSRAARCAPCGMKRAVIPRPAHTATCCSLDRLQGRGIQRRIARGWTRQPLHTFGTRNRRTGQVRGALKATRKPRVDFSVARRVCRGREFFAALLRNDSWATRASVSIRWCGAVCTLWGETDCHSEARPHLHLPLARQVARPRNPASDCARLDAAAAPHVRNTQPPDRASAGLAKSHEEAESRFLSRAPGLSRTRVLRGAPSK